MNPKQRAERALRHAPVMPVARDAIEALIEREIVEAERQAVRDFVKRVEARAEANSGAYGEAIRTELDNLTQT